MTIQVNCTEGAIREPSQIQSGTPPRNRSSFVEPIHVISVLFDYAPQVDSPAEFLNRYSTVKPWAHALRELGAKVTVAARFKTASTSCADDVEFVFISDRYENRLRKWQIPSAFNSLIGELSAKSLSDCATVVHAHGLFHPLQVRSLRRSLPDCVPIIVQHHAERPWHNLIRPIQRWGLSAIDGFFFSAVELASSWLQEHLISRGQLIFPIMEGSNNFHRSDRSVARRRTQLSGDPVLLWVGRLISLKDPLTVLEGFERLLLQLPKARLYMAYTADDLLPAIRARTSSSPHLSSAVTLLGKIPHDKLEEVYNSSDYFVLGSHYEGSGFALAEAMACGVIPVVTAIPSFKAMTGLGEVGACWTPGNSESFVDAFRRIRRVPVCEMSERTTRFFNARLSYPAIARDSLAAYQQVLDARSGLAR